MKMELDKKLDTIRLNVLAANFGDLATRRQMIQEFGDYPDALWGVNENGEKVMLSIQKNGITERVFQSNRWVRVNEYDADGCEAGETYEGRWAECPKPTATDTDEELELSDAQSARNDEIYNAAYEFCKVMAEDDRLEWNMEILGELADLARRAPDPARQPCALPCGGHRTGRKAVYRGIPRRHKVTHFPE